MPNTMRCAILLGMTLILPACLESGQQPESVKTISEQEKNALTLTEVWRVVFLEEPKTDWILKWVDIQDQGGSLEGIYRALSRSSYYRKKEVDEKIRVNGDQFLRFKKAMIWVEKRLSSSPILFDKGSSSPLEEYGVVQFISKLDRSGIETGGFGVKDTEFEKSFQNASLFTVKRLLAEKILEALKEREADRTRTVEFYLDWVEFTGGFGVDFGLEIRNQIDREFHKKWAEGVKFDLIVWECLNRAHRLLN